MKLEQYQQMIIILEKRTISRREISIVGATEIRDKRERLCFKKSYDCVFFVLINLPFRLFTLQFFVGIPSELIPKTDTGNIKSVNLKQWIKLRTHLELEEQIRMIKNNKFSQLGLQYCCLADNRNNNIIVECPSSNDVVFRRGKTMNTHSGNARFQNLLELHVYEHSIDLNTCLNRRKEIEIQLIQEVRKPEKKNGCGGGYSSGRFLTWDVKNQWWVVIISDDEIETKIHYAFRDFQKKMLRTQQQQQKVLTGVTNLNSLFVRQQDGQTKKRYKDNNSNNKNGGCCSGINNSNACGYFFSTDDAMDPMHIFNYGGGGTS